MRIMPPNTKGIAARRRQSSRVALDSSHLLEVVAIPQGAQLRLLRDDGSQADSALLSIEIVIGENGPVVRMQAASVQLDASESLSMRCKRFEVDASESIALRAAGTAAIEADAVAIKARRGRATIHANDDVQLLGEQVLLNCERRPAMPTWVEPRPSLLPCEETSGDSSLLDELRQHR